MTSAMSPGLRPWIAGASVIRPDERRALVHPPDAATALVFRAAAEDGRDGRLTVVGPRTRASYFPGKRLRFCVRLRLSPGSAGVLLGVPARALVDRAVPLADLWGAAGDRLERDLGRAGPDPYRVLRRIEAELAPREAAGAPADAGRDRLLRAAARALAPRPDRRPEPVVAVARRLAVSERHLREVFTDGVGLSPKRFARIERVRTVLAHAGDGRFAQLAALTGYYDQSHMTADFHSLMGVPPGAFFSGRLPATRPCHPV
ncbi:helix-turn-helix domain-containing protein [Microbispora corallina]|uniref:AraC family transcriptional regulator n=1 Tax=Microbispora corallina TaxID=83302 RepID=UPI0031E33C03